jgi:hypothetical protein
MCLLKSLGLGLAIVFLGSGEVFGQEANGDNLAATWHFAGSAQLANNTNFDNVKKILTLDSSLEFQHLALNRFSSWLAKSLFAATNDATAPLRPLLDDVLSAESFWALGGTPNGPLNFMVALRLEEKRAQAWNSALDKVIGGAEAGGAMAATGVVPGRQWKLAGGQSFWTVYSKGWLLAGYGDDLGALRAQYLEQLSQNGRPGPALNQTWLEGDLDWPRLAHWLPDFPRILQLARAKISFTAQNQSLLMSAKVIYAKAMPWKFDPWRIPSNIIHDPLISFTAGQDIAAYLDPGEPLSQLTENPLAGQYYVWALGGPGEIGLQTYGAWPVAAASNSLPRIATEAAAAFNPALKQMRAGELRWQPERQTLLWANLGPMLFPTLQAAPETNGEYLLLSFFPVIPRKKPAPDDLFQQILGHTNLVYYDWEGTGQRLMQWQLLSGMLPVLPRTPAAPPPAASTNNPPGLPRPRPPLVVEENWLTGVTPMLVERETITVITRTGPAELTVVRQSPFALTSLELVLLSHWLSGTGSPGINPYLLPAPAKVTGPGINASGP